MRSTSHVWTTSIRALRDNFVTLSNLQDHLDQLLALIYFKSLVFWKKLRFSSLETVEIEKLESWRRRCSCLTLKMSRENIERTIISQFSIWWMPLLELVCWVCLSPSRYEEKIWSLYSYLQSLGILVYGIMLILVGVVALYSIVLLLRMCDITGHRSYEEIAFAAFGKSGMNFVIFCITLREVYKHCQLRARFLHDHVTVVT